MLVLHDDKEYNERDIPQRYDNTTSRVQVKGVAWRRINCDIYGSICTP